MTVKKIRILPGEVDVALAKLPGEWPWQCQRPGCSNTALYCPAVLVWACDLPPCCRHLGNSQEVVLGVALCAKCLAWAELDRLTAEQGDMLTKICDAAGVDAPDVRPTMMELAAKPLPDDPPRTVWSPNHGPT